MERAFHLNDTDRDQAARLRELVDREAAEGEASRLLLPHLLTRTDDSLHTEALLAHMRGLLRDLALRLLRVEAEATGDRERDAFAHAQVDGLHRAFAHDPVLCAHVHETALEVRAAQLAVAATRSDATLTPLLQSLIGHAQAEVAGAAMAVLTAQTRFAQTQRRLELPIEHLPFEVFDAALSAWRRHRGADMSDAMVRAEGKLRGRYEEASTRRSLMERLHALTVQRSDWLQLDQAGASLFLTALAARSRQSRYVVAKAAIARSQARLALSLRAAGMRPASIASQCAILQPDGDPLQGIEDIGTREAGQLIARLDRGAAA